LAKRTVYIRDQSKRCNREQKKDGTAVKRGDEVKIFTVSEGTRISISLGNGREDGQRWWASQSLRETTRVNDGRGQSPEIQHNLEQSQKEGLGSRATK